MDCRLAPKSSIGGRRCRSRRAMSLRLMKSPSLTVPIRCGSTRCLWPRSKRMSSGPKTAFEAHREFLGRVWRLVAQYAEGFDSQEWRAKIGGVTDKSDRDLRRKTHQSIAKVGGDLERFQFNTAVASLMEWVNSMYEVANRLQSGSRSPALDEAIEMLVLLLAPFAPHQADELWEGLGQLGFLYRHEWPQSDPEVARADEITLVVQVNGKVRDKLTVSADSDQAALETAALASPRIAEILAGQTPKKIIVVPGKLVSIVV